MATGVLNRKEKERKSGYGKLLPLPIEVARTRWQGARALEVVLAYTFSFFFSFFLNWLGLDLIAIVKIVVYLDLFWNYVLHFSSPFSYFLI